MSTQGRSRPADTDMIEPSMRQKNGARGRVRHRLAVRASADLLKTRAPPRCLDRRQHVALPSADTFRGCPAPMRSRTRFSSARHLSSASPGCPRSAWLNIEVSGGKDSGPAYVKPAKSICVLPLPIVIEASVCSCFGASPDRPHPARNAYRSRCGRPSCHAVRKRRATADPGGPSRTSRRRSTCPSMGRRPPLRQTIRATSGRRQS